MKPLSIILVIVFVLAVLSSLKVASDVDDHEKTMRDSKEEK